MESTPQSSTSASTMRIKVTADRSKCCGYGLCAQMCPQLYTLDDAGLVVLTQEYVPAEWEEEAREGASACPAEVIVIERVEA